MIQVKPFLKWAGGKGQLLPEIYSHIKMNKDDQFDYVEPFVGAGAMLFFILETYPNVQNVVINDLNKDLIDCYKAIKNNVDDLVKELKSITRAYLKLEIHEDRTEYFKKKRVAFNKRDLSIVEQSAILIFMNKTCFNGLYRVNLSNGFNVPHGKYKNPSIYDETNLREISKLLQRVTILNGSYSDTLEHINSNTLCYIDPPYRPLNATSNFKAYSASPFGDPEQIELKEWCDTIKKQGKQFILSNSDPKNTDPDDEFFDDLYKNYKIHRVEANRNINSKGDKRGKITEILVTS